MNVLAIAAHPDDIDFTCGATVARLCEAGHHVTYCCVTNGQAGGRDSSQSRLEAAKTRRGEQNLAAATLGVKDAVYLDKPDGQVEANLELRRDLTRVIRQTKPCLVIAPSPRINFNNMPFLHPDHLAVGRATLAASRCS